MAQDPSQHLFQSTQSSSPNRSFNTSTQDVSHTPETLYVYSLGIRDIQAKSIQYKEQEAYVTKPFDVPGNVMEIQLEAEEDHPVFDDLSGQAASRQTSVEYYVSYKDKPSASDWIAILPVGETAVLGERLLPQANGEANLRFLAHMTSISCFANGLKMPIGSYTILSGQRILINAYDPATIYTVDYTPSSSQVDPWTFKLSDYKKDVVRLTQRFSKGTAYNKTITLDHHPFIDLSRMREEADYNPNTSEYRPIQVFLKDASIQGPGNTRVREVRPYHEDEVGPFTYNRTLYQDKSWSTLKEYDLTSTPSYLGFDYYHWKDKLTFTEHFNVLPLSENLPYTHGNADIEVHYDTLMTHFRLKIILRRNAASEKTVTPKVEYYRLKFNTIT